MLSWAACPFGGGRNTSTPMEKEEQQGGRPLVQVNRQTSSGGSGEAVKVAAEAPALPTGQRRVRLLYEVYVHLPQLREVWEAPVTANPVLEPAFAAGFHGIELCFLLLAEFVSDPRTYVSKRPRVEAVAEDIRQQCQLLAEVVDAELEDEGVRTSRLSLTQPFPFEGCPPTTSARCYSPGLERLTSAVRRRVGPMTTAERNSIIKLVLNLTAAFSCFERWSVGLGIEHQLDALRAAVGLAPLGRTHILNLDYDSLVRPWVAEHTLTGETYSHSEDFFFRTIHLGTECWASVALSRVASAEEHAAAGDWHVAAARVTQASRVLHYLGSHVMLLTSMNLRDYLLLKVELEGTSGEGSAQVKTFRPSIARLLRPLAAVLLQGGEAADAATASSTPSGSAPGGEECGKGAREGHRERLERALMLLYEHPDRQPGLYNYAKALEDAESGLLGGFYYKHFCLACSVIGSEARGTMQRAVAALKRTYETPLFPQLDAVRSLLGAKMDAELAPLKGRMMHQILQRKASSGKLHAGQHHHHHHQQQQQQQQQQQGLPPPQPPSSCPFGRRQSSGSAGAGGPPLPVVSAAGGIKPSPAASMPLSLGGAGAFEAQRQQLHSWEGVPVEWRQAVEAGLRQQVDALGLMPAHGGAPAPLALLDHAWGQLAPLAQYRAWVEAAALHQLGNPAWDVLFGQVMPTAAAHIRRLLGLPGAAAAASVGSGSGASAPATPQPTASVHFGSNSHELVSRLLSALLPGQPAEAPSQVSQGGRDAAAGGEQQQQQQSERQRHRPLRVLTTDTEFYSLTRQLNRFTEAGLAAVHALPAEPAATFAARCAAEVGSAAAVGQQYDVLYCSQVTYLTQQTLVPSIPELVQAVHAAAAGGVLHSYPPSSAPSPKPPSPLVVIDGYHGFAALPTDLSSVAEDCCYVAGMLKHAGCGANCAFIMLPARLALRPLLTGWLADPWVLASGSSGVAIGSEVGYDPGLALQGGTPSYLLPLLTFNHLMQLWEEGSPAVSVEALHAHVLELHAQFLGALDACAHPTVNTGTLVAPAEAPVRSHTLVFRQRDAAQAKAVVEAIAGQGVLVDCRKQYVRLGFGAGHCTQDVAAVLAALTANGKQQVV